jgi:hypothetical protein
LIVVRQTATGIRARRNARQGRHALSLSSRRSAAHRKGHVSRGYAAPRKPNDYRPPVSNPAALLRLAAHEEATMTFGDMARDVAARLNETPEWRVDVSEASGKSLFRLRLVTEPIE